MTIPASRTPVPESGRSGSTESQVGINAKCENWPIGRLVVSVTMSEPLVPEVEEERDEAT